MASLPREMQYQDVDEDILGQSQFIETRIIQPVAGWDGASQGQIRFMLPKTGVMDRNAYISYKCLGPNNNHSLPLYTGGLAMIQTATLLCGGRQVQRTPEVARLLTMTNYYRSPHDRDNKQAIRTGQFTGLQVDTTAAGLPGHWGINSQADWCFEDGANNYQITSGYRMTNNVDSTPEWRIYLADLFPMLYANTLPLGLIDNNFSIVLDLTPDIVRGQRSITRAPAAGNAWLAGTNVIEPRLVVDLAFYDDPIDQPTTMDRMRESLNKGVKVVFTDSQLVIRNQPAVPVGTTQQVDVLLALDHQIVRNILIASPFALNYGAPTTQGTLTSGQYFSTGSSNVFGGNSGNTLNLSINSVPVYPNPINTDAKIWNEMSQVFPEPFQINSAYYSYVGQVDNVGAVVPTLVRITDKSVGGAGRSQAGSGTGLSFYKGMNLSKTYANVIGAGTAISREPVLLSIVEERVTAVAGLAKIIYIWCQTERLMSIMGGQISVSGS